MDDSTALKNTAQAASEGLPAKLGEVISLETFQVVPRQAFRRIRNKDLSPQPPKGADIEKSEE